MTENTDFSNIPDNHKTCSDLSFGKLVRGYDHKLYVIKEFPRDKTGLFTALKNLQSPHYPKIHEINFDGSKTTVVMEYVEGKTLLTYLKDNKVSIKDVECIFEQLLDAIEQLHNAGIVHKDIKPANIVFTEAGKLKLIDFGTSYLPDADLTEYIGTVGYAAPEQFISGRTDARADIFSLGVTLEKMLGVAGKDEFLMAVARKCENCRLEERYQTIEEIRNEIKKYNLSRMIIPSVVLLATVAIIALLIILL